MRPAKVAGLVLGSLALVVALLVAGAMLWLHSARGRGWIERELGREVKEQLGLTLSVGRVGGSLLRSLRLEALALYDPRGRLIARAEVLSARYRLAPLIRRHEVDQLSVVRPVVVRLPPLPSLGEPSSFSIHELTIRDGSFRWRGHDGKGLSTKAAIHADAASLRAEGQVALIFDEHPLALRARVERDLDGVRVATELKGAAFAARGEGIWADGRLTARLESLDVDPDPSLRQWTGRGALHARGTAMGPIDALAVKLHGHGEDRGFAFGALADLPQQTARLTAFIAAPKRRAGLHARATLHGEALELSGLAAHSGATRLAGSARVERGVLDARLEARVDPAEASLIDIHPAAPILLQVALHGPPRALAVRLDGRLRAAQIALTGRVDLRARRGRVSFVARDVRPSEIEPRAPALAFSGAFTFDGALRRRLGLVGDMSVTDGSLRVAGRSFERLRGVGRVQLGQPGEAQVQALSGQLHAQRSRPLEVQTTVRWDGKSLRFDASHAVLDENRATGEVVYGHDPVTQQPRVDVRARTLSLAPALIEELTHRRPHEALLGDAGLVWTPDGYGLHFTLATELGPMEGVARWRRDHDRLEAPSIAVTLADNRLRGAARIQQDELVATIDELILQPALVRALWPTLEPARTVRIQGAVAGPRHALDLHLLVAAGASTARLRGRIDLPARKFRLVATLDTFYLQSIKQTRRSRLNLELFLQGQLVDDGVNGRLFVRHASGTIEGLSLDTARLDATLEGPKFEVKEALIGVPGAVVEGRGGGTYRDFDIGYGVVITNSRQLKQVPQVLRLMIGLTSLAPGRSVVGAVKRQGGGKVEVTHHVIPPPFRLVNLIYHLMRGQTPRLSAD